MLLTVEAAGCPNACRHCGAEGAPPFGGFYRLQELRQIAAEWGPLGLYHEPTAHPDFPQIFDPAIRGEEPTVLSTNGYGLARMTNWREAFEQLQGWGYEGVSCTVHGFEEHHDWFASRRGAFQDILTVSRRALEAGLWIGWNLYLDALNLPEIAALVEFRRSEFGQTPSLGIPHHYVNQRLWHYEKLRPSLEATAKHVPAPLLEESFEKPLEELTEAAWAGAWREATDLSSFRHFMESPAWPPQEDETGRLYATRDRTIELRTYCGPRMPLGRLDEGRQVILERLSSLPGPHPGEGVSPEDLRPEDAQLLHTGGWSVRYKAIALRNKSSQQ